MSEVEKGSGVTVIAVDGQMFKYQDADSWFVDGDKVSVMRRGNCIAIINGFRAVQFKVGAA